MRRFTVQELPDKDGLGYPWNKAQPMSHFSKRSEQKGSTARGQFQTGWKAAVLA